MFFFFPSGDDSAFCLSQPLPVLLSAELSASLVANGLQGLSVHVCSAAICAVFWMSCMHSQHVVTGYTHS